MVVADEVKVVADDERYGGFVRVRSEMRGVRWIVVRRAAIAYILSPYPPQYVKPDSLCTRAYSGGSLQ